MSPAYLNVLRKYESQLGLTAVFCTFSVLIKVARITSFALGMLLKRVTLAMASFCNKARSVQWYDLTRHSLLKEYSLAIAEQRFTTFKGMVSHYLFLMQLHKLCNML